MLKKFLKEKARFRTAADFPTIVLTTILVIFGVVMVFSASYYSALNSAQGSPYAYLKKQAMFAVIGFVLMYLTSYIDYHRLRKWTMLFCGFTLVLFVLLPVIGTNVNGATRWIRFGPISLMPGEIAKLTVIILTAGYLSADVRRVHTWRGLGGLMVIAALFAGPVALQPNLSTALTIGVIIVGMMFLAGFSWKILFGLAGIGIIGIMLLRFTDTYWGRRVTSFMDPFSSPKGDGYQVVQSLLALGTGGLTGRGLGNSIQKNLYLPEPQNDFILAVIGEELGLIGILVLLLVFLLLVWRICRIALDSRDRYGLLIAGGVAIMIGVQVIFNVAVVTSSMPPTGVALPFISYGGNSLWILMISIGIVLNISRQSAAEGEAGEAGKTEEAPRRRPRIRRGIRKTERPKRRRLFNV